MGDGFDVKLNPEPLVADHLMVTGLLNTSPEEPRGLVTCERCVAGPSQRMSKDTVSGTDTGFWRCSKALGILKKSGAFTFVADIRAFPAPNWTSTASGDSGTVQNKPSG